ncbi:MAG: DUF4407 domain-containing protein [Ferruginibacter sp.]
MDNQHYKSPQPGSIMKLLWKAAGGDRYILERATYSDQMKYLCLGGIVVSTGVMAGLSGGYAFYTIFAPKAESVGISSDIWTMLIATLFGIIWGLIIFNIDRFIVTCTGKGDGTEAITWEEFRGAIPRIIMGIIIAITISKPVEIRMFKTEIDLAIKEEQDKEKKEGVLRAESTYQIKVAEPKKELNRLDSAIDIQQAVINSHRIQIGREITNENKNGPGEGKRAESLKSQIISLENAIDSIKHSPEYVDASLNIKKIQDLREVDIKKAEQDAASLDGLLIRMQKAYDKAGFGISLFITLLFIAIELTPIFFKLMLTKTPYDYMEENIREIVKAEHKIEIEYNAYPDRQGHNRDRLIYYNPEIILTGHKKMKEAQQEIADYAIQKYIEAQKKQIDLTPPLAPWSYFEPVGASVLTSFNRSNGIVESRPGVGNRHHKEDHGQQMIDKKGAEEEKEVKISSSPNGFYKFISATKNGLKNAFQKTFSDYKKQTVEIVFVTFFGFLVACYTKKIEYGTASSILSFLFYSFSERFTKMLSGKDDKIS